MYSEITREIRVQVTPVYLDRESSPADSHFMWAYKVRIDNMGAERVQLVSRSWKITDGNGRVTLVKGRGVVGEQPFLGPGEGFEYTSGTPLATPSGFMGGEYVMETAAGESFTVKIPTFSLDLPQAKRAVH